jgi:hypothetical protein
VTLTIFTGSRSQLTLPVRPPQARDKDLASFPQPETSAPLAVNVLRTPSRKRILERDMVEGKHQLINRSDGGCRRFLTSGLEYDDLATDTYSIVEDDPLSAQVRCEHVIKIGRGDWQTRVETSSVMSANAETFYVTNLLDAYEGNTRVFTKTWTFKVPRDLV